MLTNRSLTNVPLGIPCVHIQSLANQKVPKPYTMPYFLHCWALLVVLDRKNLLSESWILGPSWTLNPKSRFFASESGFDHGQFRQRPHSIKPNNDSCIPVYWRKIRKGSQREDCGFSNAPSEYRWFAVRCHSYGCYLVDTHTVTNCDLIAFAKHWRVGYHEALKKHLKNSLRNWLLLDFTRLRQPTLLFQLRGTLNLVGENKVSKLSIKTKYSSKIFKVWCLGCLYDVYWCLLFGQNFGNAKGSKARLSEPDRGMEAGESGPLGRVEHSRPGRETKGEKTTALCGTDSCGTTA